MYSSLHVSISFLLFTVDVSGAILRHITSCHYCVTAWKWETETNVLGLGGKTLASKASGPQ